ncbi:MAG TPA: hypothetical protein PJ982_03625 [Lacipirellulaceae bacterium]|nr:hypothetical protein [Lacipirellulaceae bacterium]
MRLPPAYWKLPSGPAREAAKRKHEAYFSRVERFRARLKNWGISIGDTPLHVVDGRILLDGVPIIDDPTPAIVRAILAARRHKCTVLTSQADV